MNKLKELVEKIYIDLQSSDWIKEYPELSKKKNVAENLEAIALSIMPDFVAENDLDKFADECDQSYTETTFKKYIKNYSKFLNMVEQEFYNWLLIWLAEGE